MVCSEWILDNFPGLLNVINKRGESAAHVAASNGHLDILKLLVERGISPSTVDGQGDSSIVLQLHQGEAKNVTITKDNVVTFHEKTVVAAPWASVRGVNAYYEVTLKHGTWTYIGWATEGFLPSDTVKDWGVGDDSNSYGFKENEEIKKYNGEFTKWGVKGDKDTTKVLGVAADLVNGRLLYCWNGHWKEEKMGVAFSGLKKDITLFPAISGAGGMQVEVNLGNKKFQYEPPDHSYRSVEEIKGRTILQKAVEHEQPECFKYLVDTFPELLEKKDNSGWTALHEAACCGSLESMIVLLDAGADIHAETKKGQTPLDMAKKQEHEDCVAELLKRLDASSTI